MKNMKKWFKKMYYDEKYQTATDEYADILRKGKSWGTDYTGNQKIGNHKMTTIEALEKELELVKTHLEVAKQMKAAKEAEDAELGQRKENTDDE